VQRPKTAAGIARQIVERDEAGLDRPFQCCPLHQPAHQPARPSLDNSRAPDGMRSLHVAAVTRNVERSADETAEGSHNCGEIVPPLGSEPTKLDQRVDWAALDFAEETDFALLRACRWGHTSPDRPIDKIDQRMGGFRTSLAAPVGRDGGAASFCP
jgi:hypothetical protein